METRLILIAVRCIWLVGFMLTNTNLYAQQKDTSVEKSAMLIPDMLYNEISKEDLIPIDSINKKNKKFLSFIIGTFYTKSDNPENPTLKESTTTDVFNGMRIDTIYYVCEGLGGSNSDDDRFSRITTKIGSALHVTTKQSVIEKTILLKQGDGFSSEKLNLSEYLLRETGYLTDAKITPVALTDSTVSVVVITRDKLSIGASVDYRRSLDSHVSLYDRNFLGRGNTIEISEFFNVQEKDPYKAIGVKHVFNNLFGTFASFTTEAAYGEDRYLINAALNRDFIEGGDFAGGISYLRKKWRQVYSIIDTLYNTDSEKELVWFGKSFRVGNRHRNIYLTAGYERTFFYDNPFTTKYFNPYFHNREHILASVGIYKELFYKTNMINGFGYTEDVPYGYKAEVIGGYIWSQYRNTPYLGAKLSIGHKLRIGYINISAEINGFLSNDYNYHRTIAKMDLLYFTNLISLRSNYFMRMFLRLGYTGGFKMLFGEREQLSLNGLYAMRGIGMRDNLGVTRSFLSQESVFFAPWHVLGFKFALFNYFDMGTLGYNTNPLKNQYYGSVGIGLRLRNDNLIFNTIEIRLSTMLKFNPNVTNNWQGIDTPSKLRAGRFIPTAPKIAVYE